MSGCGCGNCQCGERLAAVRQFKQLPVGVFTASADSAVVSPTPEELRHALLQYLQCKDEGVEMPSFTTQAEFIEWYRSKGNGDRR